MADTLDTRAVPPAPTEPVGRGWMTALSLANVACFAAFFGPLQVLLAQQAEELFPTNKEAMLGTVTAIGAVVSLLGNPVFGALSDRTGSRFGRRRPWVLVGALVGAGGLALLSGAQTLALMILGWALVQGGTNASYAAILASIPDQVPRRQRGVIGGWVALSQTVGVMSGVGLAMATGSWAAGYLACAVFLVVVTLPFVLGSHDRPVPDAGRVPFRLGPFVRGFWVSPHAWPDFTRAWVARFLVHTGNALGLVYLYYFLQDAVGYADPEAGVFTLTVLYSVFSVLTAAFAGRLSDRVGRRRVFVAGSGAVMAFTVASLALYPVWPVVLVGATVLGAGFGVFASVNYALLTEVLPNADDVGRHLGVINIAAALPQVIAPVVAATLVTTTGSYRALYLLAAGLALAGSFVITRIRSVP